MQLHQGIQSYLLTLLLLSLFTIGEGASRIRFIRSTSRVVRSSSRSSSSSSSEPVCPTDPCITNSASCYIKVGESCTGNEDSCTMGAECVAPDQNTTTTTTSSTTAVSRCQCFDPVYTVDLNKLCVPAPGEIGGVCLLAGGNLTCAADNSFCDNRSSSVSWHRCMCNDGYQRTPDLQCCSAMKLTISGLILIFLAVFVIP